MLADLKTRSLARSSLVANFSTSSRVLSRDLQTEIARLEPWQAIARSDEKTEEFVKFTAEAFYKAFA